MKKVVNIDVWNKTWLDCASRVGMKCVCGALATPKHEKKCRAFHSYVEREYERVMLMIPDKEKRELTLIRLD